MKSPEITRNIFILSFLSTELKLVDESYLGQLDLDNYHFGNTFTEGERIENNYPVKYKGIMASLSDKYLIGPSSNREIYLFFEELKKRKIFSI